MLTGYKFIPSYLFLSFFLSIMYVFSHFHSHTKMICRQLDVFVTILLLVAPSHAAFFYPNPQASLIEHILVDTHGAFNSGFADAITPCTNYVSGNQSTGRETAAQWIRVAFHDFVTLVIFLCDAVLEFLCSKICL